MVGRRLNTVGVDSSADTFLITSYLFEAYLKYITACFIGGLENRAPDIAYEHCYRLIRSDGLGDWHSVLMQSTTNPLNGYLGPGFQPLAAWLTKKRTKHDDAWFEVPKIACLSIFRMLGLTAPAESEIRKIHQIIQICVTLRNKTKAHGAVGPDFFAAANPLYVQIIAELLQRCPICQSPLAAFSKRPDGRTRGLWLAGTNPKHMKDEELPLTDPTPGLYFYPSGLDAHASLRLLRTNKELTSFSLPNGNWNDRTRTADLIDYGNGTHCVFETSEYIRPPAPLPVSETHGSDSLEIHSNVFGNLPVLPSHYVNRPTLERIIDRLLRDRNHHIITLHGTGGIGKTSLALYVAHRLARSEDSPYEQILWFSARDIDLQARGTRRVRPAVQTLEEIARKYHELFGGGDDLPALATALETSTEPKRATLFVFDNFETLADPRTLHEFLDEHTILPNKVLITSRERAFKADYPVEVRGMEWAEADSVLRQVASELAVEGILDEDRRRRLFEYADGHPYVMRVLAGEIGAAGKFVPPDSVLPNRGDILDAVFERSFARLSDEARWVFLLAANWKSAIPEVLMLAVGVERMRILDGGIEECLRTSLIDETEAPDGQICIEAPQVARVFGRKKLRGDPDRLLIEEDLRTLQQFGVIQRGSSKRTLGEILQRFCEERIQRLKTSEAESIERTDRLLVRIAERWSEGWRFVAKFRFEAKESGIRIDEAARRAVEEDPNNSQLWLERAGFARSRNDTNIEILCLVSYVELNPKDVRTVSDTVNRINPLLRDIPRERRTTYVAIVRDAMERLVRELDATDRSRLAWLYLNENNIDKAREHAEAGLQLDSQNLHCRNVIERIERG